MSILSKIQIHEHDPPHGGKRENDMTKNHIKTAVMGAFWTFEKSGFTHEEFAEEVIKLLPWGYPGCTQCSGDGFLHYSHPPWMERCLDCEDRATCTASWIPLHDAPATSPCLVTDGTSVEKARWKPRNKEWVFPHAKLRITPTKWMPLPKP